MPRKIEISHRTIVFTILFLLFLWLLYIIRDIILIFFVALLIMAILDPTVRRLSKFRIPRGLCVFVSVLPVFLANFGFSFFESGEVVRKILSKIGSLPGKAVKLGVSIFSNI